MTDYKPGDWIRGQFCHEEQMEKTPDMTDQMQIAQIAQYAPELRACIARNPSTYPALLEWLAQLNDPAINAALRTRQ